jgi:hypothetical protein
MAGAITPRRIRPPTERLLSCWCPGGDVNCHSPFGARGFLSPFFRFCSKSRRIARWRINLILSMV